MSNTAQEILDAVGGPGNITHLTHCATRLRFVLNDASVVDKDRVEAIDGVLGAVPQSGDRYQIVIGGAVQSVFNEINNLPSMAGGAGAASNDDVKAAARAKARGKNALVDAFFQYLSHSFRPLPPVLPGAPLILAFLAALDPTGFRRSPPAASCSPAGPHTPVPGARFSKARICCTSSRLSSPQRPPCPLRMPRCRRAASCIAASSAASS